MVEHFDDLLAVDHLLDVAVQLAEAGLLLVVIRFAAPAAVSDVQEHGRIADGDDQRELPVEHKEHDERAGHLDEALYDHGEAVVERVGYGVHVVGEVAHDVAAVAAVEPDEGQVLQVRK